MRESTRNSPLPQPATFDEQLWPVNVALVVLGAFVAGICLSVFRFDDPRILYNAATWLAVLPLLIGTLIWALRKTEHLAIRRVVLLSAVLSVILNLAILVIMACTIIFESNWLEQVEQVTEKPPDPPITVPEYAIEPFDQLDRLRRNFDEPVPTGTPEKEDEQLVRHAIVSDLPLPEEPSQTERETIPLERSHVLARHREMQSAPHRSPDPSRLSRLDRPFDSVRPPATGSAAVDTPSIAPPSPLQASSHPADPQPAPDGRAPLDANSSATSPASVTSDRSRQQSADRFDGSSLPRPLADPAVVPADLPSPDRALPAPPPTRAEAVRSELARATVQPALRLPAIGEAVEASDGSFRPTVTRSTENGLVTEALPGGAEAAAAKRGRRTASPSADGAGNLANSDLSSTDAAMRALSESLVSTTPRRPAPDVRPFDVTEPGSAPSPSLDLHVPRAAIPRAPESEVPTRRPLTEPSDRPQRTRRVSELAVTERAEPRPASARAARVTDNPTSEPARPALAKSLAGMAGSGRDANLDRDLPALPGPARVASASAKRPTSVQEFPEGQAVSPRAPARISRSIADRDLPSAVLRAQPLEVATATGARQPALVESNASAALTRAAASAPPDLQTASKGEHEIDMGPTRMASSTGPGISGGGGQPVLNDDTRSPALARTATGGDLAISLTAENLREITEAPSGDGGGQPRPLDPRRDATALVRTSPSGHQAGLLSPPSTAYDDVARSDTGLRPDRPSTADRPSISRANRPMPGAAETAATDRPAPVGAPLPVAPEADTIAVTGGDIDPNSEKEEGHRVERDGGLQRTVPRLPAHTVVNVAAALDEPQPLDVNPIIRQGSEGARSPQINAPSDDPVAAAPQRDAELGPPSPVASLPRGIAADVPSDLPAFPPASPVAEPSPERPDVAMGLRPAARQKPPALIAPEEAPSGVPGIAEEVSVEVGDPSRRAQPPSEQLQPSTARFVRRDAGAPLSINRTARVSADAFQHRLQRQGDPQGGGRGALSPETEEAIELGLLFLSRHQLPDGRWSLNEFGRGRPEYENETASMRSDTAATGLALLAFLGAAYHHQDFRYQQTVLSGLEFLVGHQLPDGNLYVPDDLQSSLVVALYSHAIATLALCEAYGMTLDPALQKPAQKAIDFIVHSQHEQRGGWRYTPGTSSDTSVTGWMMMALQSGQLAGLQVPSETFAKIDRWLDLAQASESERHLYCYNPFAPDTPQQRHGRQPSHSMTSVALLMRLYLGWRRDNSPMIQGAEYLMENLPGMEAAGESQRDTYYWFYATQVMFHMGDKYWEAWNNRLHPLLLDTQETDGMMAGSWNPRLPVPDRWGPHAGRIYVTALNLLSLEVYYRHLPIYDKTAR